MEQLTDQTSGTSDASSYVRIDAHLQRIVPEPRDVSEETRTDYSNRQSNILQQPKMNLGEAAEVGAEEVWGVTRTASPEVRKESAKVQLDVAWAIYSAVYELTPQESMLDYFQIDKKSAEAKLLAAMSELEVVRTQSAQKVKDSEEMSALLDKENQQLRKEVEEAKAQLKAQLAKPSQVVQPAQPATPDPERHDPDVLTTQITSDHAHELKQKLSDALTLFASGHTKPEVARRFAGYPLREAMYFIDEYTVQVDEEGKPVKK